MGLFIIAAFCLSGCSSTSPTNASLNTEINETKTASKQSAKNGMSVYLDPQTGEFISEPKPGQKVLEITPEMQNATSSSSEGLVEEKSPIPGGGVTMDLQGRFQSPLIITQDPTGNSKTLHLDDFPKHRAQQPGGVGKQGEVHEQK